MERTFFTSDMHLFHKGILKWRTQFKTVEEMHEHLIGNWNSKIGEKDRVYHVGDFTFLSTLNPLNTLLVPLMKRLNGDIVLIKGNHDYWVQKLKNPVCRIELQHSVRDIRDINVNGQKITLCHYPMVCWNHSHHGAWLLHGHLHNKDFDFPGKIMNICTDNHNFTPLSFDEVAEFMSHREDNNVNLF